MSHDQHFRFVFSAPGIYFDCVNKESRHIVDILLLTRSRTHSTNYLEILYRKCPISNLLVMHTASIQPPAQDPCSRKLSYIHTQEVKVVKTIISFDPNIGQQEHLEEPKSLSIPILDSPASGKRYCSITTTTSSLCNSIFSQGVKATKKCKSWNAQ